MVSTYMCADTSAHTSKQERTQSPRPLASPPQADLWAQVTCGPWGFKLIPLRGVGTTGAQSVPAEARRQCQNPSESWPASGCWELNPSARNLVLPLKCSPAWFSKNLPVLRLFRACSVLGTELRPPMKRGFCDLKPRPQCCPRPIKAPPGPGPSKASVSTACGTTGQPSIVFAD